MGKGDKKIKIEGPVNNKYLIFFLYITIVVTLENCENKIS